MKQLAFAAFTAFWAAVATLVSVSLLVPASSQAQPDLAIYTLEDVAAHNTADDCWMAIEGNVYDFTDYMPRHPAPEIMMLSWCGMEATEGMRTKGYGIDHSAAAWEMMEPYQIGILFE